MRVNQKELFIFEMTDRQTDKTQNIDRQNRNTQRTKGHTKIQVEKTDRQKRHTKRKEDRHT